MVHKALFDILIIRGKIAEDIQENNPTILSSILVFLAGFFYGLTMFFVRGESLLGELNFFYLLFFILFGYMYMVASQLGITLMLWAMCRILKGLPRFFALFSVVGYTFLPYGLLVSAITYLNSTTAASPLLRVFLVFTSLTLLALFIYALVRVIRLMQGFSYQKASICVALFLLFFGSFIYVFGY